ncbi:expressed unknown protein [Seminavis robusta]|uniref:Uncharacterized protein n=1 Tax=Seminavis robusta TaxID=568900 RepID=A0A9N8ECT5_9STRA|nr:expressed unknown protein [Seminavis robusta]|eukprot:Sro758_g198080.1 n/a (182) ;mRNA; f:28655-29200
MAKKKNKLASLEAAKASHKSSKRKRREVQVVSCPADFPVSARKAAEKLNTPPTSDPSDNNNHNRRKLLDWNDTAHEIRSLGATAFVGQDKRSFDDEQYEFLTGRKRKKHAVPLPIVRGIKKAAAKRTARQLQEARDSGTVLPKSMTKKNKKEQSDKTAQIHGPAPSVGFMMKGVLKVKAPP